MAMDQDKKDRNEMVNENYALVGTNIACLRQIYGEDQAALAEAIGVGETAISNYEKRKRTPQRNELFLIAEHYQVAIDDLINYDFSNEFIETEVWLNDPSNRLTICATLFPIIDEIEENQKFQEALTDHIEIYNKLCNEDDGFKYANSYFFGKCARKYKEAADEGCMAARANLLWWPMIYSVTLRFFRKNVTNKKALQSKDATVGDMLRAAYLTNYYDLDDDFQDAVEMEIRRDYLGTIIENIAFLKNSDDPLLRDLADYYMAIAYKYHILGVGRVPRTRSRLMGEELLRMLNLTGNKFAKDYFKVFWGEDSSEETE